MKFKTFASTFLAAIAFVSTSAFAAVTYDDSQTDALGNYAQTGNAEVVQGASARANDIFLKFTAPADVAVDKTIVVRLPDGLNFASAPKYKVTPQTATSGLSLKDSAGDATLTAPLVTLTDTNGDGGNDRASVTVATAPGVAAAGDSLTITVNVTADADAKAEAKKATVILEGSPGAEVALVTVIKTAPTLSAADSALITVDQKAAAPIAVTTPTIAISIPAGAKNGNTVTLSVNGKLRWDDGTSTVSIVASSIKAPVTLVPLTGTIGWGGTGSGGPVAAGGNNGTSTITLSVQGAPATGFTDPVPVTLQINSIEMAADEAVGPQGVTLGGTAGVSGKANLVNVKKNGSSAALTTGQKVISIVKGGKAPQVLPSFTITENFDGDALTTTGTITITAGSGLSFVAGQTATISISDGGATKVAGGTSTASVIVFKLTDNAGTKTITFSGIDATATATGDLTVTVGGASIDSKFGPAGDVITVAKGVDVGTVSVKSGSTTLAKVGPKQTGINSRAVKLNESTYGSITRAAAKTSTVNGVTTTTKAFIKLSMTNAKMTSVAITEDYPGSAEPTFTCTEEAAPNKGTFICVVDTESTGLSTVGTETVTITPTYSVDGAVGDVVSIQLDGNAGVSGSVDLAKIEVATKVTTGEVPQLTIGSADTQSAAPITITENFTDGIVAGQFRVIAPAGVKFSSTPFKLFTGQTDTVVVSTFNTNDTLVLSPPNTPSITFTPKVIVSDSVAAGDITFDIIDGDIDGATKTGITSESVNAAYAVAEKAALSGGADISVGANFSATNAVTGGVGAKTATSSATGVATVTVDGDSITVTGVAAGAAVITVKDSLGATDAVAVTVTAAAQTAGKAGKALDGSALPTGTAFAAGASKDGGATQATEFTTADTVEIVATVTVGTDFVGKAGGIHVALATIDGSDKTFSFLNEDSNYETWDISGLPGVHIDAEALAASYNISLYSGKLAAGTYRFALAYSSGGNVYFTGKAIQITVTE